MKISLVLPVYKGETTLAHCLDSILAQSLSSIEVLCINDQSPDESQTVIDAYARQDPRIAPMRNARNIGLGATRNRGVAAAKGDFIFHIDPDDALPPGALERLYDHAVTYGSDMTRGAYLREQVVHGERDCDSQRVGLPDGGSHIINTTLAQRPELLDTTEGHWSFLYRRDFARRVPYPEDLTMGQDSVFLVDAMTRAERISVTDALVYAYRFNPASAMNTFAERKFMDALEWRRRAWGVLARHGLPRVGQHLLFDYWTESFFASMHRVLSRDQRGVFFNRLRDALVQAGYPGDAPGRNRRIRHVFDRATAADITETPNVLASLSAFARPSRANEIAPFEPLEDLRVATACVWDFGGAGNGTQRRVEALRAAGVDAQIHCLFKGTDRPYVHEIPFRDPEGGPPPEDDDGKDAVWTRHTAVTQDDEPGLSARERFSSTTSVADLEALGPALADADIIHLHWVAGMIDYDTAPDVFSDKPVVWTFADMNAFTGGCHYSEGCEGYKTDCRACPLLGGSDRAHLQWKEKKAAYARLPNMDIICPSQWLADRVAQSTLLGDRRIHVIPNAMPVDRFEPVNKLVARKALGLPFDASLIAFGAQNLHNARKGGDLLQDAIRRLGARTALTDVAGLFFGANTLDLGIESYNVGGVTDERELALVYAAADVFAFPSREDNSPLTVPEALLSGAPVVAFRTGNVPELVAHQDTGYVASMGDLDAFVEGLQWALGAARTAEALRRSLRGHAHARAHNDPRLAAERHIALYRRLISEHAARRPPQPAEA